MSTRIGAVLVGAAVLAAGARAVAQQPDTTPVPPESLPVAPRPWVPGERLEYNVKLGMFNVGRASLEVLGIERIRGVPCYHVRFALRGHALFYTLTDSSESWFGVEDLVSRRFDQNGNENGRTYNRHYDIDAHRGTWIRNGRDTGLTVAEPLDEASFFYFTRTLPLNPGDSYELPRYFMQARNPVTITVLGRQDVSVPAGHFNAVAVRPVFQSGGMFSQGGEAIVWFADDSTRIPIRIRSRMAIGTLDISLRSR